MLSLFCPQRSFCSLCTCVYVCLKDYKLRFVIVEYCYWWTTGRSTSHILISSASVFQSFLGQILISFSLEIFNVIYISNWFAEPLLNSLFLALVHLICLHKFINTWKGGNWSESRNPEPWTWYRIVSCWVQLTVPRVSACNPHRVCSSS